MRRDSLRIGTCSWNYESWVGLVYSRPQRAAAHYLAEYAQHYDTAEIDSWFYRIPDRSSVLEYVHAVPAGFRWTCKAPQQITLTHHRTSAASGQLVPNPDFLSIDVLHRFLEVIEPILGTTDMIMFEFEYLSKAKMPGGLSEFMDRLNGFVEHLPREIRFGFEPRNASFLTPPWFRFLAEKNLAHVFSQKIHLPNVWAVYDENRAVIEKMPRALFRLLGGDRQEMEKKTRNTWNATVEPKDREIELIVGIIASYVSKAYAILNVNNHYEGSAPITIEKIESMLASHSDRS